MNEKFKIEISDKLNLWTINYLLYGAPKDRNGEKAYEEKLNEEKPYIFIDKAEKMKRLTTAKEFLENHLKISNREWLDNRGFSDVMLKQKYSGTGAAVVKEFINEWSGRSITDLYDVNAELMGNWLTPNFRKYIRMILPNDGDEFEKEVPQKFENVFSKNNKKDSEFSESEKIILRILAELDRNSDEDDKEISVIILTWLLLLGLLHGGIEKLECFYEFKKNYPEIIEKNKRVISADHFAVSESPESLVEQRDCKVMFLETRELYDRGWTPVTISETLVWNDKLLYDVPEGDPSEGTAKLWAKFLRARPETFGFLVTELDNNIVGNYSICGLDLSKQDIIERGELFEGELTLEKTSTASLFKKGEYILLILNISCNVGYSTVRNNQLLINGLLKQLLEYAKNGVYFSKLYTTVFLEEQESLYSELGFDYIVDNVNKGQKKIGKVYKLENFPYNFDWECEEKNFLIEEYKKRKL